MSSALTQDGKIRGRVFGYEQTGDSYLDNYELEKNGFGAMIEADLTDSTLFHYEVIPKPTINRMVITGAQTH